MPRDKVGLRLSKIENHLSELDLKVSCIQKHLSYIKWMLYWVSSVCLAIILKIAIA